MIDITKPLSPDEIISLKKDVIPDFVYKAVNILLAKKFINSANSITLYQNEIIEEVNKHLNDQIQYSSIDFVTNDWLNFEASYKMQGWCVDYHTPFYNENWDAYFKFYIK